LGWEFSLEKEEEKLPTLVACGALFIIPKCETLAKIDPSQLLGLAHLIIIRQL
jgi:hypothetical protein